MAADEQVSLSTIDSGNMGGTFTERWRRYRQQQSTPGDDPVQTLELEYAINPMARYGWGKPSHREVGPMVAAGRERYAETLRRFVQYADALAAVPTQEVDPREPFWNNRWFQGLDPVSLYGFLAGRRPAIYAEIGSGFSTRFARRAIDDQGLETRLVCVDPHPRSEILSIVDEHIPNPLESVDLDLFDRLGSGDVLLFDGSHRAFTNSDVTVFFTEVLPRLNSGVLVGVHDIFLPWDYRPDWSDRWYSEQYLLTAWLLGGDRLKIELPNFYISTEPDLCALLNVVWAGIDTEAPAARSDPSAFWFEICERAQH